MSPQTVNAYYEPTLNDINFPAAILLAPFFSENASDASNFGAIGMVIGHEITHGFDTSGSQFDGHGAMRDWWSAEVKARFEERASCMIEQYNGFEVLPGLFVNGELTITENIADQGGIALAYEAYRLTRAGRDPEPTLDGITPEQQLFVSLGQIWCEKATDAARRQLVSSDPHSPARFRVNGSLMNLPGFAQAFGCAEGTPMAPARRCQVW
jgi:putative endopeptidase